MYIYICIYIYVYIYMYIYIFIYVYLYMYIYIYAYTGAERAAHSRFLANTHELSVLRLHIEARVKEAALLMSM